LKRSGGVYEYLQIVRPRRESHKVRQQIIGTLIVILSEAKNLQNYRHLERFFTALRFVQNDKKYLSLQNVGLILFS